MMEEKARTKMTMVMGTAVQLPRVAATASEVKVPAALGVSVPAWTRAGL